MLAMTTDNSGFTRPVQQETLLLLLNDYFIMSLIKLLFPCHSKGFGSCF